MRRPTSVPVPTGLDVCACLLDYDEDVRRLVAGIKYRNDRRVLAWLADGMAELLAPPDGCIVTWAPTTPVRRRQRGFDQSELLARAVARRRRAPCRALLVRAPGRSQTGRGRADRLEGVRFRPRGRRAIEAPVLVVDDVMTTGATLSSAAVALRAAGAGWVGALTAAYTAAG